MSFITRNFLLTSDNAEQEEWARLYTLPTFQLSKEKIHFPSLYYIEEKNKWAWRHNEGYDIFLTEDEVMKLVGCAMCGKPKVNNWARYCDSRCPYYFDTPSLKEILL